MLLLLLLLLLPPLLLLLPLLLLPPLLLRGCGFWRPGVRWLGGSCRWRHMRQWR